ncbi:MAG: DUF4199 domain-containing protein [Chitinophagaceae bacterium]|nr:DUF4199 domain-containing protein [Chitinophagaceae bacterium]
MQKNTTVETGFRYGVICGCISMVYSLIIMLLPISFTLQKQLGYVTIIFLIAYIFISQKSYKNSNNGFMSYGEGVKISSLLSLVSAGINSIFFYIYFSFLDPTYREKVKDDAIAKWEEAGMSEEQIDQVLEISKTFFEPGTMAFMTLVFGLSIGIVIGLVISAIQKKTAPEAQ